MKFRYFRDPDNFAFKIEEEQQCSVCKDVGRWFDAGGFFGVNEIDCICDNCLSEEKLEELEIETNEAFEGTDEEKREIIYKTPALPTWQGNRWPYVVGGYCVFERIASKEDFDGKDDFVGSFSNSDTKNSDMEWLWDSLPVKIIKNVNEGADISVYLFSRNGKKHCTWDSS